MKCHKCQSEKFTDTTCAECGEQYDAAKAEAAKEQATAEEEDKPIPAQAKAPELSIHDQRKERVAHWTKQYKDKKFRMPKNRLGSMSTVLEMAQKNKAKGILDLGCGRGEALEFFKEKGGFNVQGYEIVPSLGEHQLVDQFAGIHSIPEDNKSWDIVLLNCVLEHLIPEDLPRALKEIKRVAVKAVYIQVEWGKNKLPTDQHKLFWVGVLAQNISKRVHVLIETKDSARLLCILPPKSPPPMPKAKPLGVPVMKG